MAEPDHSAPRPLTSAALLSWSRFLAGTCLGLISSLFLAAAMLFSAAIVWLLTKNSFSGTDTTDVSAGGLNLLVRQLQTTVWGPAVRRLVESTEYLQSDQLSLGLLFAWVLAALTFRWLTAMTVRNLAVRNAEAKVQRLRQHIHRKAIRLEPADLTGEQTQATDRLFRQSAQQLEQSASVWSSSQMTLIPDLMALSALAALVDWRVAVETIVPVVLCWFALRAESDRRRESSQLLTEQADRELKRLAEGLRKTRIVSGFAMEQTEQQHFDSSLQQYRQRCHALKRHQNAERRVRRLILIFSVFVPGYLLARHTVSMNALHFAAAALIAGIAVMIFQTLQRLHIVRPIAEECRVLLHEIQRYIQRVPLVGQNIGAEFMEPMSRTLQFDQVCLSTPRHPRLLNQLDLKIQRGQTIAIVSLHRMPAYALASMIPRFVDPDSGLVLIDGKDVRNATLESLRAEAVFVSGNDPVFNTSVMENITCGQSDISRQQVIDACKIVHADHFIRNLPRGYDAIIGEHGTQLDSGQTFRLSLARAAVRKPALLIIEEPTAPLDEETRSMLDDAYQRLRADRTVIFLPSRLSTVKRCDRVILLHDGRVAEDDSHDKLVRASELYRHWEYSRFNSFRDDAGV